MEQGELPENLYDFLYVDTGKINSLSAQIFSGLQESIRRIESTTKETSKKMSGTVPPNLLSGEMGGSKGTSFSTDTVSSPHDLIAIDALHRLKENGWIRDDLADAEVGEAIMLPVTISLFDATNLYESWTTRLKSYLWRVPPTRPEACTAERDGDGKEDDSSD